jgi:hypothetical protein
VTEGPGAIVSKSLEESVRQHKDISKEAAMLSAMRRREEGKLPRLIGTPACRAAAGQWTAPARASCS